MTTAKQPPADRQPPSRRRVAAFVLLGVLGLAVIAVGSLITGGCDEDQIDIVYGQREGASWASVNGTGVLGRMFQEAGHTVYSRRMLSPRLHRRADCIVWFPDDFRPPSEEVCRWLEDWLREEHDRTLIYVGRDFDAAVWYWDAISVDAPEEQKREIQRRKWEVHNHFLANLRGNAGTEECDWFTIQGGKPHRKVRSLEGSEAWLEAVDPKKLEIELYDRMVPSQDAEVLLESEGDVLVASQQFHRGRLILVANGSFLMNLPLVHHEHRKLAGRLIDEVGPPGQTVVFLESGFGGPLLLESEHAKERSSPFEIFHTSPTGGILMHLAVVGIILCFCRFPIFGRPRDPEPEGTSDFGRHIDACAELLERSGDAAHATARLLHYQKLTRPTAEPRSPAPDARRPTPESQPPSPKP